MPGVTTRHARALTLATASFGLGLTGHLEAGGHATSPVGLGFAAAWCALSGWSYSRNRLSGGRVGGVLLANQVVLHVALAVGSASAMTSGGGADCGQSDGTMTMGAVAAPGSPGAAMQMVPSGWMLLAHLLATVLAAVTILAVQAVCLGLVTVARRFDRLIAVAGRAPLPLRRTGAPITVRLHGWTSRHPGARPGRGPPALHVTW